MIFNNKRGNLFLGVLAIAGLIALASFLLGVNYVSADSEIPTSENHRITIDTVDVVDYNHAIISGNSMSPTIPENSIILLLPPDDLDVGEVIVFNDNGFIAHRIIEINGDEYVTKGDNNFFPDPRVVSSDDILFVVGGVLY